eukprot:1161336-Pelagomonas_calceolata.AAC.6
MTQDDIKGHFTTQACSLGTAYPKLIPALNYPAGSTTTSVRDGMHLHCGFLASYGKGPRAGLHCHAPFQTCSAITHLLWLAWVQCRSRHEPLLVTCKDACQQPNMARCYLKHKQSIQCLYLWWFGQAGGRLASKLAAAECIQH